MATRPESGNILGRLTGRVADEVLDLIDPNPILENIDLDALLERVDLNALMDRIDIDRVIGRVDLDALLERIDVEALVRRSGVPEIVQQSTGRFAGSALDSARRQLLGLDVVVGGVVDRLFGRRTPAWLNAPAGLRSATPVVSDGRLDVTGRYAGVLSRGVALLIDAWLVTTAGTLALAGLGYLARTFLGYTIAFDADKWWWLLAFGTSVFAYSFLALTIAGRTVGKAVVGLRVVRSDGRPLSAATAFLRTLTWPVSVMFAGLGLAVSVVHPQRKALHDLLARTAVVTDWAPRPALLSETLSRRMMRT